MSKKSDSGRGNLGLLLSGQANNSLFTPDPHHQDHYTCRLCGKEVRAHGNFGGGAISHAMMHVRRDEAEDANPWGGGKRHLDGRFIIRRDRPTT